MNKKDMNKFLRTLNVLAIVILIYVTVADLVFAFRHPWTTQTQRFMNLDRALLFKRVTHDNLRGKEQ
jgi:hypothetical protein